MNRIAWFAVAAVTVAAVSIALAYLTGATQDQIEAAGFASVTLAILALRDK